MVREAGGVCLEHSLVRGKFRVLVVGKRSLRLNEFTVRESLCILVAIEEWRQYFQLATAGCREDDWKTYIVFAVIGNSRRDRNR